MTDLSDDELLKARLAVHEAAMSDDPDMAAFGRALKLFMGASDTFESGESERNTPTGIIVQEEVHALISLAFAVALGFSKTGGERAVVGFVARLFDAIKDGMLVGVMEREEKRGKKVR